MDWLSETLLSHTAIQAVIIICLICALGLSLARLRFRGISLGITYVFLIGILAGAIGHQVNPDTKLIDPQMLDYAESFGLVLFVYALGLQVGPGFVSAFRRGGTSLNGLALAVVGIGTLLALAIVWLFGFPFPDMMGVLCGATTNTPALGAAQQALKQLGMPDMASTAALACAVTYPLGMVGVIFALMISKRSLRPFLRKTHEEGNKDEAFIASFEVSNPAIFNKKLSEFTDTDHMRFTVTRLWRQGRVMLPDGDTELHEGDRLLVVTSQRELKSLTLFFGKRDNTDWNKNDIDWNNLDHKLVSERILITQPRINGKRISQLNLRRRYGVNVSRVKRSDIQLVARPDLILRMGDRVTVVGTAEAVKRVANELGNTVKLLDEPNMVTIFIGIVLGLLVGSIPFFIPGMSYPVRLGLAGGPIIVGILVGAFGPRVHMVAYTTSSANLMLRSLGLSMYLGCLGIDAGTNFIDTVMQPVALYWLLYAVVLTFVPVMIVAIVAIVVKQRTFATTAGMLCGAMANPIALGYVNDTTEGDHASIAYATVYPLCMFVRVIIAQVVVMLWFS